jgi:hypothetical protein
VAPGVLPGNVDVKALNFRLARASKPAFGMSGPYMGIANRIRIWRVCSIVKRLYFQRSSREAVLCEQDDEDSKAIMEKSTSLQIPMVLTPQPKGSITMSRQLIRSWDDLKHPSKKFESFWDQKGLLTGLGVRIGADSRIFGQGESTGFGIVCHSVPIPADNWIKEIVLHFSNVDLLKQPLGRGSVEGLSVSMGALPTTI